MYRAGHLIRRSSVRLKSLSGNHGGLQMIISQIQDVRRAFKAFACAQSTLSHDLLKWSTTIDNGVIEHCFMNINEINNLWTEAQNEFSGSLKQLRSNFNVILEGEQHVDQAKQIFTAKEDSERSIRKELQKSYKRGTPEEIQILRDKLSRVVKTKELAHLDVVERSRENEAVRMIRLKEGMVKLGRSQLDMAHKASILFKTQIKVASLIPDVHDKAIHKVKYDGRTGSHYIEEAKEQLRNSSPISTTQSYQDPPPPYSPSKEKLNELSRGLSNTCLNDDRSLPISDSLASPTAPLDPYMSFTHSSPVSDPLYPNLSNPEGASSGAEPGDWRHEFSSSSMNEGRQFFKRQSRRQRAFSSLDGTSPVSRYSYSTDNNDVDGTPLESPDDSDSFSTSIKSYYR